MASKEEAANAKKKRRKGRAPCSSVRSLGRTPQLWNKIITLTNQYFKVKREPMLPIPTLSHFLIKAYVTMFVSNSTLISIHS